MLSKEELRKLYAEMMQESEEDNEDAELRAKTIQEQIDECEAKLLLIEKFQKLINYREVLSSVVDDEIITKEYQEKRNMMLTIYDEERFSKKMSNRMKFSQERGMGSISSFFASLFRGRSIDNEIKIKQDERIRQEITNKYVESINIKVHELQKNEITKAALDNFLLEMNILADKTPNNKKVFDSIQEQIQESKDAMDSSEEKAKLLIKAIKNGVSKALYEAQFQDYFNHLTP